ncbi:MAG: helix-turn-helix transcriptional regulator [Clostridiaceae bacterium]|nr:helix-turn-helix transcriptional regulator [Clostridiaceae bacterium]
MDKNGTDVGIAGTNGEECMDRGGKISHDGTDRTSAVGVVNEQEIIKAIMVAEGVNNPALARMIGIDRNSVWQRLNSQRRMSVPMLVEMALALSYRVVVEPRIKNVHGTDGEIVRVREKFEVGGKIDNDLSLGSFFNRTHHDVFEMNEKNTDYADDCGGRGKYIGTVDEAEILKNIMVAENVNNPALARMIGVDRNTIWARLNGQRRISVALYDEMLRALGYRLIVEPMVKYVYGTDGEIVRIRKKFEVGGRVDNDLGLGSSLTKTHHDVFEMNEKNTNHADDYSGRSDYIGTIGEVEILKEIMVAEDVNTPALAHMLGVDRNTIWARLNGQRLMSVAVFEEMLRVLGYRLVVEPVVKNVYGADGEVVRTREKYEVKG